MSEVNRRLLSSFTFFFISVFCNFAIQYNSFEFNKLQWAVLLSGGIVLWVFPFVIEPLPNKMIAITILSIYNLILDLVYLVIPRAFYAIVVFITILQSLSNAVLLPLLAIQIVNEETEMHLVERSPDRKAQTPLQRLYSAILIAAYLGILSGNPSNEDANGMLTVSLIANLMSFAWYLSQHGIDYQAFVNSRGRLISDKPEVDNFSSSTGPENDLSKPILDGDDLIVDLDRNVFPSIKTITRCLSKLPQLLCYGFYWGLLTIVLIYMFQLSCQFRYSKGSINPSHLRIYPLFFSMILYPLIEWLLLPKLDVWKTYQKLLLSTVAAVLSLVSAAVLESFRVKYDYGSNYYGRDPFTDPDVSSCPTNLDDYCFLVPVETHNYCEFPPMMSTDSIFWQAFQFLLISFSISLTGSCFLEFCFYEFFPASPYISVAISIGTVRILMSAAIMIHYYDVDPIRLPNYLTFNLNKSNIIILLIFASLFVLHFIIDLFIQYVPFQAYFDYVATSLISDTPQPEAGIPLTEYRPSLHPILPHNDEKYDVFLTHDWGTEDTQFLNHRRVSAINDKLTSLGLKTWFDQERMEGWNVRDQMTQGISRAHCVLVFITERYAAKINSANPTDNCYYEFNFAVHRLSTRKMIPVVMEQTMKDTRVWEGRLAAELASNLYVNMSDVIAKVVPSSQENAKNGGKKGEVQQALRKDEENFDQKCKEIVDLVGNVLVKPLKELTSEQTKLFLKSVGCLGVEVALQEMQISLSGQDLNNIETIEDLLLLDLKVPRFKLRSILEEIERCKVNGVRMSNLLRTALP